MTKSGNEPAYPQKGEFRTFKSTDEDKEKGLLYTETTKELKHSGVTIRQYAAIAAMQGLLTHGEENGQPLVGVPDLALAHADALLKLEEETRE